MKRMLKKLYAAFNKVYKTGEPIKTLEWEMITKKWWQKVYRKLYYLGEKQIW